MLEKETTRLKTELIRFVKLNYPLLIFIFVISSLSSVFIFFSQQYDWDILNDVIIPLKNNPGVLPSQVKSFSFLLPVLVTLGSNFTDPLIILYFISFLSLFSTLLLTALIVMKFVSNKFTIYISVLAIFCFNSLIYVIFYLDDNLIPLPFILLAILFFLNNKYVLSGLSSGLALSFHLQSSIVIVAIILTIFIFSEKEVLRLRLFQFIISFLSVYAFFFALYLLVKVTGMPVFNDFSLFVSNNQWSLLSNNDALSSRFIIQWLLNNFLIGMISMVMPIPDSFSGFNLLIVIVYCFIVLSFFLMLLMYVIFMIQILKNSRNIVNNSGIHTPELKSLVLIAFFVFIITFISNFLYDGASKERWVNLALIIIPTFIIILNSLEIHLANIHPIRYIKVSFLVILISAGLGNGIIQIYDVTGEPSFANKSNQIDPIFNINDEHKILEDINANSLVIFGSMNYYGMISYYRSSDTIYLEQSGPNDFVGVLWNSSLKSPVILSSIVIDKSINFDLAMNKTVFVHSSALEDMKLKQNNYEFDLYEHLNQYSSLYIIQFSK